MYNFICYLYITLCSPILSPLTLYLKVQEDFYKLPIDKSIKTILDFFLIIAAAF